MVPIEHAPPRACDLDAQQQLRDEKETPDAAAAKSGEEVICDGRLVLLEYPRLPRQAVRCGRAELGACIDRSSTPPIQHALLYQSYRPRRTAGISGGRWAAMIGRD